jgi:hypothetical protein
MGTTLTNTGITFNDATVQTTAAAPSAYIGGRGQVFTASGTFTVPTGVTSIKVTVTGGGGGGGGEQSAGSTGGTSSFGAYCTASGGAGGTAGDPTAISSGGIGASGDINIKGSQGWGATGVAPLISVGGGSIYSAGGVGVSANGVSYGSGGSGGSGYSGAGGAGAGGGTAIRMITGLTPGSAISVTIGAGGNRGGYSYPGGYGVAGIVVVEW